jgi:ATP-binding cassette, subfamily B, bacterial
VVVLIGLRLVIWVLEVGRGWLGSLLGTGITAALRRDIHRRLQAASLLHLDRRPVGATMARMTGDVDRIEEFIVSALPLLVMNVLLLVGIVDFLLMTSWRLTLYVLAPMPVIAAAAKLSWTPVRRAWVRQADRWARLSDRVSQSFGGIREVRAFGQESRELRSFEACHDDVVRVSIHGERLSFAFFAVLYLLMGVGQIAMWYFGGRDVLAGTLTLGTLLAVIAYLWMLYWPLQWLGQLHQAAIQALTGAERVFEVLDTPLESGGGGASRLPRMRGAVRFDDVSFGYDPARPVVQHITLEVQPGERIAIVGRSGAGKTTLINLLCRFYQPDAGRIVVDGIDLRDISVADLRGQMAVVLQEPFLFSGSIAENIRYGRPDARFEAVMAAARAAGAHEFIVARDDGYDSEVGERGERLSGGERQRIAIARALLCDPRILILDEATSSVDAQSETVIREAIARVAGGRTTFIIAHKLSSVRHADRFVVLDRGRVLEIGRYDDLLQQRGALYEMVMSVEPAPVASS